VCATADLFESIAELAPGSEVVVRIWRAGEPREFSVKVAERTPPTEESKDE
jgi:S1-C subfamily serine protease